MNTHLSPRKLRFACACLVIFSPISALTENTILYSVPARQTGGGCPVPAVFGATPEEAGLAAVASNNMVTGSACGGVCNNPATFISADENSYVTQSNCTQTLFTHPLFHVLNPKQPDRQCGIGNPIIPTTGAKTQRELDYAGASAWGLNITRYYSSIMSGFSTENLGLNWRHDYQRVIVLLEPGVGVSVKPTAYVWRPTGRILTYKLVNSAWVADVDIPDTLVRLKDAANNPIGWRFTNADDEVETYNESGKLLTIANKTGLKQTLTYDVNKRLSLVTDSFGRKLTFAYDASNRVQKIIGPADENYIYAYDANSNLVRVTYPDLRFRTYRYNEAQFTSGANLPNALTGIIDENGVRYATWTYDAKGRATSSEHALGTEKYTIGYAADAVGNPLSGTVTEPLGTNFVRNFGASNGVVNTTGQSQAAGSGCGPSSSAITYDVNGNVASRTDFNGNVTKYGYDLSRNLETSRVEGFGKPEARTVSTQWHATYRLPTKVAEPLRMTTNTYDGSGNLLSKTIQATTDANGSQGFGAALTGVPRTWSYTYNNVGQVLTATGPRTDVLDKTTYVYDAQGNLVTITNAAGHLTTLSNYDASGRVRRIVDPNGMTTDLQYHVRGWLSSKTVSGAGGGPETTSYEYDGVGQMTKATMPDGSAIFYTYDAAHRLTNIADSLGNSVAYTLDVMSNRIKEEIKDPNGVLARQTTRVYDALNRLKEVTGGTQ